MLNVKKELLDKDKLLTYLYDNYNKAIVNLNEAKELNIEYVIDVSIKNCCKLIAERIEKGAFNVNVKEKE